jgi:hypothetical protein
MPSEGPTKYVPTEEEIKKGEDTMTDAQKEFDAKREESAKKLKEMGVEGYLESMLVGEALINMTGVMNGHKIEMYVYSDRVKNPEGIPYKGFIDDQELKKEEIDSFFEKYKYAIIFRSKDFQDAKDVGGSIKQKALKDIGL